MQHVNINSLSNFKQLSFTAYTEYTYIAAKKVTIAEFFQCKCKKKRRQGKDQGQQCSVRPWNMIVKWHTCWICCIIPYWVIHRSRHKVYRWGIVKRDAAVVNTRMIIWNWINPYQRICGKNLQQCIHVLFKITKQIHNYNRPAELCRQWADRRPSERVYQLLCEHLTDHWRGSSNIWRHTCLNISNHQLALLWLLVTVVPDINVFTN